MIGSISNGREIEIQKGDTHIQWRYVGDEEWKDIIAISDLIVTGQDGEQGFGWLVGTDEPTDEGRVGDLYLRTTTYDIYNKKENGWEKIGNVKGADGKSVELQSNDTHIQWKREGENDWTDLVSFEAMFPEYENLKERIRVLEEKLATVSLEWEE